MMTTYISLLRGINVSGQKLIRMNDLRNMFVGLGFNNVTTYVQSGNVVFDGGDFKTADLEQIISQQIMNDFGFEVPVIVLTVERLKKIIDDNPFLHNPEKDHSFMHVTFLSSKPDHIDRGKIESKRQGGEEICFSEDAVYLYCPHGYGRTRLNNNFLESELNVTAITRNWKTTVELYKTTR